MSRYDETYEKGFDTPVGQHIWTSIGEKLESLKRKMKTSTLLKIIVQVHIELQAYITDSEFIFYDKRIKNRFEKVGDIKSNLQKAEAFLIKFSKENDSDIADKFKTQIADCQVLVRAYDQYCLNIVLQEIVQAKQQEDVSVLDVQEGPSIEDSLLKLRTCFESSDNEE